LTPQRVFCRVLPPSFRWTHDHEEIHHRSLCSGLVIPGLGQILNQQIAKGLILLGLVFLLFVAGALKFAFIITP